ncbi:hypothetical protein COF01_15450 [Bacillus pseudomycoides]|uniref:Spore coat protein n=1 Tax=Bacillus pseudomycoides TaxID=64104 RepID=A0ABD6TA59_9BACI|nr:hypothetical protein CON94_28415 [Bacillus pseudomycoides]PEL85489.1 hypothetical protein CN615_17965 [Bacillus pseudomycoides]PEM36746.1 hypothetical protein CN634_19460 [Bacillus pseudomycoides]PHC37074.1 hypothetical protein COF01_15450 [Bacillus pseudomycoides]PHC77466.1 hypothetical protein COF38_08560 [Bacillus pseudomycoides]
MYRQYCYKVPYTYAQCMADCTPGDPGFDYECRPICWQYKTRPWYLQCTRPTAYTPYGMSQAAPYIPQPNYYPYSYFPMQPSFHCPPDSIKWWVCDDGPTNCHWECLPT